MSVSSFPSIKMPSETGTFPFLLAKVRDTDFTNDKYVLRAGQSVTENQLNGEIETAGLVGQRVGEGRIKHDKNDRSIIVYSMPGPSHKITFDIIKTNYPDYRSVVWRDG